ncbi:MAG TPA: TetR/AcrR family transcriptional regulator C-terminal ligand-binding domain-containing protein [Beutenbergiaceae bacterium]|nr:TetR/AcrR family transcriptional regulator C-terminal ligand-binding domain-containing protein [Beutenbergiaceae bacterium]
MSQQASSAVSRAARRNADELLRDIQSAVLAEVAEVGVGGLTMEGVARRSGAAKTSLYRRWPAPHAMLIDAIAQAHPQEQVSVGLDDLRGDLVRALQQFAGLLAGPGGRAIAAVFTERDRYPELVAALEAQVFRPRGGAFTRTVLTAYVEAGGLDAAALTPVVTNIGEALVLKEFYETGAVPSGEYLHDIVDQAILPALGRY